VNVIEWAKSVKPDLVKLQQEKGIPALWSAAQMCHESAVNGGAGLSELALNAQNYAGLKWAEWEKEYGCEPVTYGTWEVLNGQTVNLNDAFCKAPTWEVWLQVYGDLLSGRYYGPALEYKNDPMLYGIHVWQLGWATDPNYLIAVSGWMSRLYADYADTIAAPAPVAAAAQVIPIKSPDGRQLAEGWLEGDRTVVKLRDLAEALGATIQWDQATKTVTIVK
jgi:flagellum-specific peptidoglycan hydrolase FlgJ